MRATQHPSNNFVLGAPPGVGIEACHALAVTRVRYSDGSPAVRSYWRPTAEEAAAIAAGALVCFECWGDTHPPVSLTVEGVTTP